MTSKEKKEYLSRYRAAIAESGELEEEIAKWESRAEKITSSPGAVPKSGQHSDRVQDGAVALAELRDKLTTKVTRLIEMRLEIERAIETVSDDTQRILLRYRYVDGLTWEKIAEKMHYTYQWVCVLHGLALQKVKIKRLDSN